jgi:tRNA(Arg) A34 adenosine deaminase TadA
VEHDPFEEVEPAWRDAFDQAWASWAAGSMGIGAVLVDHDGVVEARGRNRVLEGRGSGPIAGALVAHAEMDAFADLGVRTAEGLTLYTTVEPCLMCAATAIAMRTTRVRFAAADPVFQGLDVALAAHAYCAERMPTRAALDHPLLAAVARVLPLAARAWSRPGQEPRQEWLDRNHCTWAAAVELVSSGRLSALADAGAPVDAVVAAIAPILRASGAAEET